MSYIEKLQGKSEGARKQILLLSIITSMSLVVVVWVYSLGDLFIKKTEVQTVANKNEVKPFALFANSITETYQNISASLGNLSSSKKSATIETTPQKQVELIPVEHVNNNE